MNIVYRLVGTKELKKVYVRIYSKKLSIQVPTVLTSKTENWDFENERFKKNKIADLKLIKLEQNIEEAFNADFSHGIVINKDWLKKIVSKTFDRPVTEEKLINHTYTLFLSDFALYWLENHTKTWRNLNSKLLSTKEISKKKNSVKLFEDFEMKQARVKIRLTDFTKYRIKEFYDYLITQEYAPDSAKKILYDMKVFCARADDLKFNVCLDYLAKTPFKDKSPKIEDIYLNEQEINSIFEYDFSHDENMDIIRDNFILSLWTGKRISDLLNLSDENLIDGFIESIDIKTNTLVKVPLHPQVKFILDKRFGHLPPKINKDEYNIQIKEICKLCSINSMTYGKIMDATKKRKVAKYYEKFKLVTSHTSRRSFATNLSKIMSIQDVAKLGAWADTKMVIHYNKETKSEVADKANKIWNTN